MNNIPIIYNINMIHILENMTDFVMVNIIYNTYYILYSIYYI